MVGVTTISTLVPLLLALSTSIDARSVHPRHSDSTVDFKEDSTGRKTQHMARATSDFDASSYTTYLGCFVDSYNPHYLNNYYTRLDNNTLTNCVVQCAQNSFMYAGVEYGTDCYCTNTLTPSRNNGAGTTASAKDCNMPCAGDSSTTCGATWRIQVYKYNPTTVNNAGASYTSSVSAASSSSSASASKASASSASVASASSVSASLSSASAASSASVASASSASAASSVSAASASAAASASIASASSASVASASSASAASSVSAASASAAASASIASASSASISSASAASAASSASVASVVSASSASAASASSASVASASSASAASVSASSASAAAAASSASAFAAQATAITSGWQSAVCIAEGKGGRALVDNSIFGGMTWKTCTDFCDRKGFTIAGVEYGRECYCGNVLSNGASLNIASSSCSMPCDGNNNANCGGYNALKLFVSSSAVSLLSADLTSQSIAIPNGWAVASNDCIQEGSSGRALVGASYSVDGMTVPSCINYCDNLNYPYAGVEYGRECYCGNTLANGASLSISATNQCSVKCTGNTAITCGGSNALQLYVNPLNFVNTTVVNGYTYQGCISEVKGRALTGASTQSASMSIETCTAYCSKLGFTYTGVEYGKECYCGNSLVNGAGASSSACGYSCTGNSQETCGGYNAISLYKTS
ncbi:uncharacterized protein IL334_001382 [Kwoniella shivajii]|uniref:WSC domain-containing protein n=1 Tax=Kwoniella shivajii TaxID=564305 RepID=A0ABZ1CRT6_9TREE|nr:hypothetical protein IL334_001382 [Kwoniella shivajii]